MRRIGVAFVVALIVVAAWTCRVAQSDTETEQVSNDLKQLCETIINQLSKGDEKGAFLYRQNSSCAPQPGGNQELQDMYEAKKIHAMQEQYGQYLGCELVQEKNVANTLRRYIYIGKYEKSVAVWTFILYRTHDDGFAKWKILTMSGTPQTAAINSLFDLQSPVPNP